ncbi:MAG TPA: THUMP domain-containing protein [Thermoplasmata archaeon]|nr:THUMP domain-containing protein [Thermoplasmata archaeon]
MRARRHNGSVVAGLVLVRYGELALKSAPVRREFERTLVRNILAQFRAARAECHVRADHGHLYVEAADVVAAVRLLRRVFGVTSVSEVFEVPSEPAAIESRLLALADVHLPERASFAVRARRTGTHPFTSQELARVLGAAVLARWPERHLTVRLEAPDVELSVEVRGPRTYLSFGREGGPGGLPLGVAGKVVALVDGVRGGLGAYLMMKRGCRTGIVATRASESIVREILQRFDPEGRVELAPDAPETVHPSLVQLADELHADGIVLPLQLEEYGEARVRWGDRVVFSPTIAFTDEEVEERWAGVAAVAA